MTPDRHASEDALVRAHLHLATSAARELARRLPAHVNRDDLSSAALLGLAQAARSWDPERGASFERHAATRIRGRCSTSCATPTGPAARSARGPGGSSRRARS
jgi:RNA polymerase sigma factor FliA